MPESLVLRQRSLAGHLEHLAAQVGHPERGKPEVLGPALLVWADRARGLEDALATTRDEAEILRGEAEDRERAVAALRGVREALSGVERLLANAGGAEPLEGSFADGASWVVGMVRDALGGAS